MSNYKIKLHASVNFLDCVREKTIDLIDDWGYDEDEARTLCDEIDAGKASHMERDFSNVAQDLIGFYWTVTTEACEKE